MVKLGWQPKKWIEKKAKRGGRGYPVGTIAYYGPDNRHATKAVASVMSAPDSDPTDLRKWFTETGDARADATITTEIATFLRAYEVKSVAMMDGIFGCPHEEGIDYPEGGTCPACPYWAGRDRFAALFESK
jgi:hypothetical protein